MTMMEVRVEKVHLCEVWEVTKKMMMMALWGLQMKMQLLRKLKQNWNEQSLSLHRLNDCLQEVLELQTMVGEEVQSLELEAFQMVIVILT